MLNLILSSRYWLILLGKKVHRSHTWDRRSIYIYIFFLPPRTNVELVAIKRQRDFGSLHVGPLTVIPFHRWPNDSVEIIVGQHPGWLRFIGSLEGWTEFSPGQWWSRRAFSSDPQIPYLSSTSTPFATHDARVFTAPAFSSTPAFLPRSLCFLVLFLPVHRHDPSPLAILDHTEGGSGKLRRGSLNFLRVPTAA